MQQAIENAKVKAEIEQVPEGVVLTVRKGAKFLRLTMTRGEAGRIAAELAVASVGDLLDAVPMQTRIRL